jgi:sugar/nucleoside kinase (ribokinase family)
MKKVLGVGAALVDLLIQVDEEWIARKSQAKGGMHLVDWATMGRMLGDVATDVETVPGGSACNTIVGLARLGGRSAFLCKVGKDELGDIFYNNLVRNKVDGFVRISESPTGRVLSAVTPDAQRTMFSFLGASAELTPADASDEIFSDAQVLYLEGYLAYQAPMLRAVVEQAKAHGLQVVLDFGSFGVVNDCRSLLDDLLASGLIDVIIANEDEARAFTTIEEELACEHLAKLAKVAVVKLGKNGALIASGEEIVKVEAQVVTAVDTTGAGDLWAAGFLYGYLNGWTLEKCGKLASAVAAEVVQVMGPSISDAGYGRLLKIRDELAK